MKNKFLLILLVVSSVVFSQKSYQIDVSKVKTGVMRGHLDLGGKNIHGDSIGVNSFYIERNNKPVIPVIGEFHFSRYPNKYWEEEIRKMKAGGITVVATYVFWNMHEFKEGVFNWNDDLNVRQFVELCAKNGLEVLMRIGPFAHGEIRNGGIPDWLYGRPIDIRSNDPAYLKYVQKLYQEIGKQLQGLMFKDGGPVIGVQLENEYQHSAAPWAFSYQDAPKERTAARRDRKIVQDGVGVNSEGNEFANVGNDHMKTLKQLAVKAGLVAPIYTATGWGYATIVEKGSIPVMAGYAFPFWSAGNKPSPFYLFKDIQLKPDYSPVSYDVNLYPSMAAELGTGMSVIYSRRPRVPGESFLPLMVRTVGSGTNGLGFYMYHGGTTPSVGNFFLSEGAGLGNKTYDYQAPIGEFGLAGTGFYHLKLINYFLRDFGADLAPLYTVLPATNDSIRPDNLTTLRYAVRSDGSKGYLFMHNYQDHAQMADMEGLQLNITTKKGNIRFPRTGQFTLKAGSSAIFPFQTAYDGLKLQMATVQPFSEFDNKGKKHHVFVSIDGVQPEMVFDGKVKVIGSDVVTSFVDGRTIVQLPTGKMTEFTVDGRSFLILPYTQALHAYVAGDKDKYLFISESGLILEDEGRISLVTRKSGVMNLAVYPAVNQLLSEDETLVKLKSKYKNISLFQKDIPSVKPDVKLVQTDDQHFVLQAAQTDWSKINDIFITFDYRGDRAICMMKGELQTDDLYTSKPWTVGLKRFANDLKNNEMYFYFMAMQKDAAYLSYLDKAVIPDFGKSKEFLEIKKPTIDVEQKIVLKIK